MVPRPRLTLVLIALGLLITARAGEAQVGEPVCGLYKVTTRILNISRDADGQTYIAVLEQGDVACVTRQQVFGATERGFVAHKLSKPDDRKPVNGWAAMRFLQPLPPGEAANFQGSSAASPATATAPAVVTSVPAPDSPLTAPLRPEPPAITDPSRDAATPPPAAAAAAAAKADADARAAEEAKRIAAAKVEAERLAAEAKRAVEIAEARRAADAAAKAEADERAADEATRIAAAKIEADRLAAEAQRVTEVASARRATDVAAKAEAERKAKTIAQLKRTFANWLESQIGSLSVSSGPRAGKPNDYNDQTSPKAFAMCIDWNESTPTTIKTRGWGYATISGGPSPKSPRAWFLP